MKMSDKISDLNLKILGQIIESRFEGLEEKMREQKNDFRDHLFKAEKTIEKLEIKIAQDLSKLEENTKDISSKLETKSNDLTKLQIETQMTAKQWGAIVGLIAGIFSSVVVAVIIKFINI